MLPGTLKINTQGHLAVGGVDTVDLAGKFDTPLYVMDEDAIRTRCREYVEALEGAAPGSYAAFASKAFLCRAMARLAQEEGLHLDTASAGELEVSLAGGVKPAAITFHGNYKKDAEIRRAIEAGVGMFVVDSFEEIAALSRIAQEVGRKQAALLRVAPGIDAHTLDAISTGRNDTKFGFTVEDGTALRAVRESLSQPGIELRGLHAHIGSQILTLEPFDLLAEKMLDFSLAVKEATGWTPEILALGGGLGIHYEPHDSPPPVREFVGRLTRNVERAARSRGLAVPRIGLEPGRSLVGEFGLTLYRVGPVKTVPSADDVPRTYVAVDGGLSDNPRPLMYGSRYPVLVADRAGEDATHLVRVAGRHCETDTLFDVELPLPRPGDLLAVLSTGAYNHTMASNYNFFLRPAVVFVKGGQARLAVRREHAEDLLRRDVGP